MKKMMCMLEDNKTCDNCCECNTCDMDSAKVCDNCAKCLGFEEEYLSYAVKDLITAKESHKKVRLQKARIIRKLPYKYIESCVGRQQ